MFNINCNANTQIHIFEEIIHFGSSMSDLNHSEFIKERSALKEFLKV